MCAKFYRNRTFNFKVMIKKPISDEKFWISLRQSWKKRVGTLLIHFIVIIPVLAIVRTFGAMHCFKKPPNSPFVISFPTPINQCWATWRGLWQHDSDQHCIGGKGGDFLNQIGQTVPTFFSRIVVLLSPPNEFRDGTMKWVASVWMYVRKMSTFFDWL